MSGRQSKLARREIRRSAAPALRTMQEQQEGAIMACIQRVNELTLAVDVMRATLHNMGKSVEALEAARPPKGVIPFGPSLTVTDEAAEWPPASLKEYVRSEQADALRGATTPTGTLTSPYGPDGDSRPLEAV